MRAEEHARQISRATLDYGNFVREQKVRIFIFSPVASLLFARVYADTEPWFRDIFASSTKEEAIQNQYEFFIQRMGGPALYSQRKGD